MKTTHTPGPWYAVGWQVEHPDDNTPDICTCNPVIFGQAINRSDKEICANARLIAAAPELLDALEFLLEQYGNLFDNDNHEQTEAYYTARTAIKNATGA